MSGEPAGVHRRLTALAAAALTTAALAALPAHAASAAGSGGYPGEVTFPAAYDDSPAQVTVRGGYDADGYAYTLSDPIRTVVSLKGRLYPFPAGTTVALAGDTVYAGTPAGGTETWQSADADTGAVTQIGSFPEQGNTQAPYLIGEAPHAWLTTTGDSNGLTLQVHQPDGSAFAVHEFSYDTTAYATQADDTGALVTYSAIAGGDTTQHLAYVAYDLATHTSTWTELATGVSTLALAPHVLGYVTGTGTFLRIDRSTLQTLTSRPAAGGMLGAMTDTATAYVTWLDPDGQVKLTTCVEATNSCASMQEGAPAADETGEAAGVAAFGDSFVAPFGGTAASRALRLVAPGAKAPGAVQELLGGGPPLSVDLSAGLLSVEQPHLTYAERADSSQGRARMGATSVDGSTGGEPLFTPASSGNLTAFARCKGTRNCAATETVVTDSGTQLAVLPGGDAAPSVSGNRVLVPGVRSSVLYTLGAGGRVTATQKEPAWAAMSGDRIVWATAQHAVMLRDLAHPGARDVELRDPSAQPNCELQDQAPEISADWVLWDYDCMHDLFTRNAHPTAVHLTSADKVDRTVTVAVTQRIDEAHLTDGAVTLIQDGADDAPAPVHVIDLRTGADTVVGIARSLVGNRTYAAASDELVAWVGDDDLVHVVPNPVKADSGPALLGSAVLSSGAAKPATQAHLVTASAKATRPAYTVEVDATRPLTSWKATLRDPHGHVVLTRKGSAPTGGAVLTWDGKIRGRAAAAGRYTWTLTAAGPGGALTSHGKKVSPKIAFTVSR